MGRHIRRDDMVMVIAGDHKGRQGKVLAVYPDQDRVLVEGVNVKQRNVRPDQQNQRGGVVEKTLPIHMSNVQPVVNGRPTRVRFETRDDGSKVRVAVRSGEVLGPPLKKPGQ